MRTALPTEPTETELSEEQLNQVSGGHHHGGHGTTKQYWG
jgi:bacteriocin-like protein